MESLANVYDALVSDREQYLERGYRSSVLTIPSVLPREGQSRDQLPQNYQSIGSRGVNNLSSKLQLTLFPSGAPFFRLSADPFLKRSIVAELEGDEQQGALAQAEIEKNLSLIEETVRLRYENSGWRPVMAEAIRHLVVVGNGLVMDDKKRGPQFVDLRSYVTKRDPEGNLIKVVVRQKIDRVVATELVGDLGFMDEYQPTKGESPGQDSVNLYTGAIRQADGTFLMWQEIRGKVVNKPVSYTKEKLPLIPLRFTAISGENYGTGYVEEYDGDLLALEMLSRAMTEGALAASKLLILVRPGAAIHPRTVATAPNGAVKQGNPEDVGAFNLQKQADFAVAERRAVALEQRLQLAFLIAFQRNAERVTAEEVRYVIQELEDGLGGAYSSLADNVQKPIVEYLMAEVLRRPDVPKLPDGIDPIISTGLAAISRGQMSQRLAAAGSIGQALGLNPADVVNRGAAWRQILTSVGVDPNEILLTDEEIAAAQQQAQAQALAERAAGPVAGALASNATPTE